MSSIERTIVQKLLESRKLEEAGFDAGGSHYSSAFGHYSKDGESISRDDYFAAKGKSTSGNTSAPQKSGTTSGNTPEPIRDKTKEDTSSSVDRAKSKKSLVSKLRKGDYIERTMHTDYVKSDDLFKDLSDSGYKVISAKYRDANHNRQSYQIVFTDGNDYISYQRSGGSNSDAPERIRRSETPPKSINFKFTSYDSIHDLTKDYGIRNTGSSFRDELIKFNLLK